MTEAMTIADDRVVTMHYTLRDDDGDVIDSSDGGEPLAYLHGHQGIVPGLERELTGKSAGDTVKAVVAPEEGYGMPDPDADEKVPRSQFPEGMPIEVGMAMGARTPDGRTIHVFVAEVHDDHIVMTTNHPLAGKTLHFEVQVTDVRAATAEELTHGHVHGPGGHHH